MSRCCLETRAFGLPCNVSDVYIGFDKQITKAIVQVIKEGKIDGAIQNVGCRVHDVPDRPASLLAG